MTAIPVDGTQPRYRDPSIPILDRVEDLLERMTIEEKVAQLGSAWVFQLLEDKDLSQVKATEVLRNGLGHITRISGASHLDAIEAARVANDTQRHLLEKTRLGIPVIVHEEICSGLMAPQATVFPQAIGVASTWDPGLSRAIGEVVRAQMRGIGAHQGLSPVLDVCRDPRWGRTEETFGEDPHLVAMMGVAFVDGLQGERLDEGVIATAKHFVGYGASEGGLNWAPAHTPARELHEVYLHPFEAALKAAGARSVMPGYHEIDGVPCSADEDLLTGRLRESWEFDGCVVSDYFSIRQLVDYHKLAVDGTAAAAMALSAGIDVELPGTDCYGQPLIDAAAKDKVSVSTIDEAVRRVLRAKFELGLFDRPFVDPEGARPLIDDPAHRQLARRIAGKSIVLLSNDGALPLAGGAGSIAVIGPNAHEGRNLYGDYTYPAHIESLIEMRSRENIFSIPLAEGLTPEHARTDATTVFEALVDRLGPGVRYSRGCDVAGSSTEGFAEAVALAAECDVAVMVMGDKAGLTEDCTSGEGRDRFTLDLPGVQEDLVRAVVATGTPVVLVLVTGRPGGSVWIHESCAAVVTAWLPGQEGAAAIVDVLTGEVNPGGKLPISHPRTVGHIPVYYGHKVSGGRSHWKGDYVDGPVAPLYPFGHGLSYTTFELGSPSVTPDVVTWNDAVSVAIEVANTGQRDGDEVVQLYVRDLQASVTRPVLELKGFARVEVGRSLEANHLPAAGGPARLLRSPAALRGRARGDRSHGGHFLTGSRHAGMFTVIADPSGPPVKRFEGTVAVADLGANPDT